MNDFLSGLYSWMLVGGGLLFLIACSLIALGAALKSFTDICIRIVEAWNKYRYRKALLAVRMQTEIERQKIAHTNTSQA